MDEGTQHTISRLGREIKKIEIEYPDYSPRETGRVWFWWAALTIALGWAWDYFYG